MVGIALAIDRMRGHSGSCSLDWPRREVMADAVIERPGRNSTACRPVMVRGRGNRLPARVLRAGAGRPERRTGRLGSGAGALGVRGASRLRTRYPADEARPARRGGVCLSRRSRAGATGVEVRRHLIALLWMEGRNDEVDPLVEANWRQMSQPDWPRPDDATEMLRTHIALRDETDGRRGDAGRARERGETGPGRRPGLARSGQPGRLRAARTRPRRGSRLVCGAGPTIPPSGGPSSSGPGPRATRARPAVPWPICRATRSISLRRSQRC